jgi:hypothetical protein
MPGNAYVLLRGIIARHTRALESQEGSHRGSEKLMMSAPKGTMLQPTERTIESAILTSGTRSTITRPL